MPCHSDDGRLVLYALGGEEGSHLLRGFYAIQHRHAKVSKNHLVGDTLLSARDQFFHSLLSCNTKVNLKVCVNSCRKEHGLHGGDAEFFVINYHYAFLLILLVALHQIVHLNNAFRTFILLSSGYEL